MHVQVHVQVQVQMHVQITLSPMCAYACVQVLFDEVEKAHPDVMNLLLGVLDDGRCVVVQEVGQEEGGSGLCAVRRSEAFWMLAGLPS